VTLRNLSRVAPTLWRSAQPAPSDWPELYTAGIRQSVKLDTEQEGTEDGAMQAGLSVVWCAIEPVDAGSILQMAKAIFVRPSDDIIDRALAAMASRTPTLVHCLYGNDRTGILVGFYRVLVQGWSRARAWDEMILQGFHPELLGLDDEWFFGHPKLG